MHKLLATIESLKRLLCKKKKKTCEYKDGESLDGNNI